MRKVRDPGDTRADWAAAGRLTVVSLYCDGHGDHDRNDMYAWTRLELGESGAEYQRRLGNRADLRGDYLWLADPPFGWAWRSKTAGQAGSPGDRVVAWDEVAPWGEPTGKSGLVDPSLVGQYNPFGDDMHSTRRLKCGARIERGQQCRISPRVPRDRLYLFLDKLAANGVTEVSLLALQRETGT